MNFNEIDELLAKFESLQENEPAPDHELISRIQNARRDLDDNFVTVNGRKFPFTKLQLECLVDTLDEICDIVGFDKNKASKGGSGDDLIKFIKNL